LRRFEAKPKGFDLWEAANKDGAMRFAYLNRRQQKLAASF
jgi:hypothetical protein